MEPYDSAAQSQRQRLADLREILLSLHKALLDSERTAYELVHGPVASPSAFLQLLINDNWFAWLRPVTTLLVQIDEALAAKKPPKTERELEQYIADTGALLSPSSESNGFWKRYAGAVQRDPAVSQLHERLKATLN